MPAELARRETRLARLREAKAELEAEAKEREEARREAMRAEGREPRDPPSGRDAFAPKPTAQRNFTDPDSRIMKPSDGAFHQSFNAQAIVDSGSQVIVVAELSNMAPDCPQLAGALDQLDENLAAIDAGLPADATSRPTPATCRRQNIATTPRMAWTRTSRPAARSTPTRRRWRHAGASRTTRPRANGWRAS